MQLNGLKAKEMISFCYSFVHFILKRIIGDNNRNFQNFTLYLVGWWRWRWNDERKNDDDDMYLFFFVVVCAGKWYFEWESVVEFEYREMRTASA